jgi:hypothetical protein
MATTTTPVKPTVNKKGSVQKKGPDMHAPLKARVAAGDYGKGNQRGMSNRGRGRS